MKLSSISPIAAILAAMADVDVYSRATQEERTGAIAHHRAASSLSWQVANLADFLRQPHIAAIHDESVRLNHMHGEAHKDIKAGRRMIVDYIKVKTQRRRERHEGR